MRFTKGQTAWNKGLKGFNQGHPCYWTINPFKGKKHSAESKEKMRKAKLGKVGNTLGKTWKVSPEKLKNFGKMKGEKHWNWKEDRNTLAKRQERNDMAYKEWRRQIWLRDNFKCKIANPDCKGRIEAHHILGWISNPELRYEVNNGITLCHAHHPRKREDEAKLSPFFQELVAEK